MPFNAKYWFKGNTTVVIQHPHGGHIRAAKNGNDALGNGGRGKFARWEVELQDDGDVRLKSQFSGKYLRIKGNGDVDVGGGQGPWTKFKVHVVKEPNVVKLESCKTEGKYIAVNKKKKVFSGGGGPHCKLVFYRQGGGGGGGGGGGDADDEKANAVDDEPEPEPEPAPDTDDDADAADDADAEDIPEADDVTPLSDDAEAVKEWLETIGYDDYVDAFIENGYDKMSTIAMLDTDDLGKMGVKAGHQKELMLAARAAIFVGHWVAIRSVAKERFIEANEGHKEKVETSDKNKKKDCRWLVEQSPNGITKVRFRSKYNSYLRMPTNADKHMILVTKENAIDNRVDLQILPTEDKRRMNIVQIWCPSNANFMTYDSNIGKDRINSMPQTDKDDDKDKQKWELIVSGSGDDDE